MLVCSKCGRASVLIMAGGHDAFFHFDDATPVFSCMRESIKWGNVPTVVAPE